MSYGKSYLVPNRTGQINLLLHKELRSCVSAVPSSSDQAIVEVSGGEDSDGAVSGAKSIQIYGSFHNML
jgi:hypothetical protein